MSSSRHPRSFRTSTSSKPGQIPIRRYQSRLKIEYSNRSITPRSDCPEPPPSIHPVHSYGGGYHNPAFFLFSERCLETLGVDVKWELSDFKVYGYFSYVASEIGHPACMDSFQEIANALKIDKQTVFRSFSKMAQLGIFEVDPIADGRGNSVRIVWIRTALRADLPVEFGGPDRSNPDCSVPHRPAYLLFEAEPDPETVNTRASAPTPMRVGAGADARMFSPSAPTPTPVGAGADAQMYNPGPATENPVAQPGASTRDPSSPARPTALPSPAAASATAETAPYVDVSLQFNSEITSTYGPSQAPGETSGPIEKSPSESMLMDHHPETSSAEILAMLSRPGLIQTRSWLYTNYLFTLEFRGVPIPDYYIDKPRLLPRASEVKKPVRVEIKPPTSEEAARRVEGVARQVAGSKSLDQVEALADLVARALGDKRYLTSTLKDHAKTVSTHIKIVRELSMGEFPFEEWFETFDGVRKSKKAKVKASVYIAEIGRLRESKKVGGSVSQTPPPEPQERSHFHAN